MQKSIQSAGLLLAIALIMITIGCDLGPVIPMEGLSAEFITTDLNGGITGKIELTWNPDGASTQVYSYNIYYKRSADASPQQLVVAQEKRLGQYTHKPAEINQDATYYYKADALSVGGDILAESEWVSVAVSADKHSRIPILSVSNGINATKVLVNWSLYKQNENLELNGLKLYRRVNAGDFVFLRNIVAGTAEAGTQEDTAVTEGTSYSYRLDAHYTDDEVVSSNIGTLTYQYIDYQPVVTTLVAPILREFSLENDSYDESVVVTIDDFENPNTTVYNAHVYALLSFQRVGWPNATYWRIPIRRVGPSSDPINIKGFYLTEDAHYNVTAQLEIVRGSDTVLSTAILTENNFLVNLEIDL